jgi:hypothetical protein
LGERNLKLHRVIAEHLEATSAARPAEQFGLLAHHYTEAGLTEQAVDYWRRAGHRAIERSANARRAPNGAGIDAFVGMPTPLMRITKTHPIRRGRTRRTQSPSIEH